MKNKILWTALAAMSLAACSNDDVVSVPQNDNASDAIQFRSSVTTSRAHTDVTSTNLSSFWVGALKDDGDNNNEAVWGENAFKYYKKNNTTSVFEPYDFATQKPATNATWPAYSLKFFATNLNLAVKNGANTYTIYAPQTNEDSDTPKVTYNISQDVSTQEDVIYATNKGSRSTFSETGYVPLNFRHALCEIKIKAQNLMADQYDIKVRGYKIYKGGYCVGTFTLPVPITITDPTATNSPAATWSFTTEKFSTIKSPIRGEYAVSANQLYDASGNYQTLSQTAIGITGSDATGSSFEGYAMAIPMYADGAEIAVSDGSSTPKTGNFTGYHLDTAGTNDGSYIALLVQINQKDSANTPVFPAPVKNTDGTIKGRIAYRGLPTYYGYVAAPISFNWEAGKIYEYTLSFKDGLGISDPHQPETVDPENYDPKDDQGGELDPEDKGKEDDSIDPGENILGKAIAFEVKEFSWGTGTTQTVNM
jgi:hypothetical protein